MVEVLTEQSLVSSVEQQTGVRVELARAGHVVAVRYDIDTDLPYGEPTMSWITSKQIPVENELRHQGFQHIAGIDITGKQMLASSLELMVRPGIGGRYAVFLDESSSVPPVEPNRKHTFKESDNALIVRLHPPAHIGPLGGDMHTFIRDLACWTDYAFSQKKMTHIELQLTIDPMQMATVNILLIASR